MRSISSALNRVGVIVAHISCSASRGDAKREDHIAFG
jgi:hypothetical protein